jgi:hypothetical protein
LYISRKEHLVKNFRFSISRSSSSYTYTKHVRESIWSQLLYFLYVDVCHMEQQKQMQCKQQIHEQMITLRILAKRYSKIRGVMPRLSLGLFSRCSMSPSIVCVLPLPVCNKNSEQATELSSVSRNSRFCPGSKALWIFKILETSW